MRTWTVAAREDKWVAETLRAAVIVGYVLLAFVPLVLLARRIAGELTAPLPELVLVAIVGLAAAGAFGLRRAFHATIGDGSNWLSLVGQWLPTAALVLLIGSVWLPGTNGWEVAIAAIIVIGEEALAWWDRARRAAGNFGRLTIRSRPVPPLPVEPEEAELLLRQLSLQQSAAGTQSWRGSVRIEFLSGQRTSTAHVAFCPAFDRAPQIEAEQVDGPPARVEVEQILPQGARFEIRLDAAAGAATAVMIEFVAEAAAD